MQNIVKILKCIWKLRNISENRQKLNYLTSTCEFKNITYGVFHFITELPEFGFMGVHIKPDDADAEIDKLVDVYDEVVALWGLEVIQAITSFCSHLTYIKTL